MTSGISNVVCCYNSIRRLEPTLRHLAEQAVKAQVSWEVIVVDNASSDGTAEYAKKIWPASMANRFRVVTEPKPGLMNARFRGFNEAKYEIVSFIDDDNWVCSDWNNLVFEIMEMKPDAGAVGGFCEAEFESQPPAWFEQFCRFYAVGGLASEASDLTWTKGFVFGAGMSIRKRAWEALCHKGFSPLLMGRKGAALTSGEDGEICKALRLAGWKLYYDPRLRLRHYMPADRLQWSYLRKVRRGMGAASIFLDSYSFASFRNRFGVSKFVKENWIFQMIATSLELAACGRMAVSPKLRSREGDAKALEAEAQIGRLGALWNARSNYNGTIRAIRNAPWRAGSSNNLVSSQYAHNPG